MSLKIKWSGKRDSNPRPSAWKADALANWAIPANLICYANISRKVAPHIDSENILSKTWRKFFNGGEGRIWTSEGWAGRFTVCSLWPLGNLSTLRSCLILQWSQRRESNPRPTDYKSVALPSELRWQPSYQCTIRQYNSLIILFQAPNWSKMKNYLIASLHLLIKSSYFTELQNYNPIYTLW